MKKGWEIKTLGEVCEIIMGQSPNGESYNITGEGVPLINGPVEFSVNSFGKTIRSKFTTQPTKLCKKGDLILCIRGSTTGRMNISGFDACIGRGVAAIRAKQYQPWVNHFVSSMRDTFYASGTGATFPNLSNAMLANFPIAMPPLPEQQRIVAILDEAFEGIAKAKANAEQNLKNARELFESHLQAVFSQRGEGWKNVSLGQICDIIGGGTPSKAIKGYWKGDISWVSPKDMKSEVISDSIDHISEEAIKQSATSLLPKGTVLIVVRSGILARIVPIAVAGCPLTINQDIKGLCPKDTVDTNYLYYFLKSIMPKLLAFVSRGATVHRLMTDQIRSLTCPLPSLETQIAIVEKIDVMKAETQRLESIYQRKTAALDELKKSLLHKAFSGEL